MPHSACYDLHCSLGLSWLSLAYLDQLCSVICLPGPSSLASNNLPLGSVSPSSSVYYNIEVIKNPNIDLIVIIFTRMQSPNRIAAGILALKSDPDSHSCPGCSEQAQK